MGALTPPAWGLQPRVNDEVPIETAEAATDRKWSVMELRQLSLSPDMASVVSGIAGVDEWGATVLSRERWGALPELLL